MLGKVAGEPPAPHDHRLQRRHRTPSRPLLRGPGCRLARGSSRLAVV